MNSAELFQRILVAVDSEGLSANAFLQGKSLAGRLGSELGLVHAVHVPTSLWPVPGEGATSELRGAALDGARAAVLERLNSALGEERREARPGQELGKLLEVAAGHPAKVILERADRFRAGLIVLGHHARRPLFGFGSTARAILSRTRTPVWVQPGPVRPVKRILVPVDFSEHSRRALDHARALAVRLGAALRVLHCYVPPAFAYSTDEIAGPTYVVDRDRERAQEELSRWLHELEGLDLPTESTFTEGEAAHEIIREAERDDLIVMGTHGRTGLSRFLIGSVAYAVLEHSKQPVLVIPHLGHVWQLGLTESHEPHHEPAPVFAN